jgi:hypothetical protein
MARIEIIFHPEASEEYAAAYAWYHERGSHLAEAFERETERAVPVATLSILVNL